MIEALVRKLSRYAPLSREEEDSIRAIPSRTQTFEKGQQMVAEESAPEDSMLMLTGLAFRYRELANGTRQIMALHIPGDFVDLHSFVLKPMDHSVAAASALHIGRVPHQNIARLLERHPRVAQHLMWDLALDAATYREWMVGLGRRTAYERMAHLFCELYYRMKMAGLLRERAYELPLSQSELGDVCGLSTVHVNRSLQALRQDGLITLDKGVLTIPDIEKLSQAAGFDPAYLHLIGGPEG